jgi:hypothetical protein
VNLSPYNEGWVARSDVLTSTLPSDLAILPTTAGIATATAIAVAPISLTAFEGSGKFMVPGSHTGEFNEVTLPAIIINVASADPGQSFRIEIIDSKGKVAMKWNGKTDGDGKYQHIVRADGLTNGTYLIKVTIDGSVTDQITLAITKGKP